MAKLVPEKWVHEDGLAVVFRTLRLRSVPSFDILRNPRALRLRGDRIPMRANRFFREACAKVDKWCRAGRVAAELHPLSGGAPRRVTSEFSTRDLDFARARLDGETVRLLRADILKVLGEEKEPESPNAEAPEVAASNRAEDVASKVASPKQRRKAAHRGGGGVSPLGSEIIRITCELMEDEGDIANFQPSWNSKAKVGKRVRKALVKAYPDETKDGGPSDSTLKKYVSLGIDKYRSSKAE
jgi:hypothetical protein